MPSLDAELCRKIIRSTLRDLGVVEDCAGHVAESLVTTSLRGVDSHGIRLFPHYTRAVAAGRIDGRARPTLVKTGDSTATLDAHHAFGHYAGALAMDEAIRSAKKTGIGAVSVSNSTHFGAAAYFALRAPEQNCIGFAFTNADALVKAHAAAETFFGTNPICFAAPIDGEEPFCLDMATSLVSWNKVLDYRTRGERIPAEWAFDADGQSVTDPAVAHSLSPIGAYKGFGLGMMVETLCALLSGGPVSKDILPMYDSSIEKTRQISHFFLALSIEHFINPATFRTSLRTLVDRIRQLAPLDPRTPMMVAGDPEKANQANRISKGIPVSDALFEQLKLVNNTFAESVLE